MTYDRIPTLRQWQSDSSVSFAVRDKDVILKRIDDLLRFNERSTDKAERFIILSDIYFTTDYWLKIAPGNPAMEKGRTKAVHALFTRAAFDLCGAFQCSINGLPRELELMWGREMSSLGVQKDLARDEAEYITRAQAAKFKVLFKKGLAYQYPWWNPSLEWRAMLAESRNAADSHTGIRAVVDNTDYGFFVSTMSRDLYMTKHRNFDGRNGIKGFFHSSYTAGDPISCAGTMLIRKGRIEAIRFDSGHYKPHMNNVRALVMALRMRGVSLEHVRFEDFKGYPLGTAVTPSDPDIGTIRYVLKATGTIQDLSGNRLQTIQDNTMAHMNKPGPNPNPSVKSPDPRSWWGNRPRQPEVSPPPINRRFN